MTWSPEGAQGFESMKIKYLIPRYTRGVGLEIGVGEQKTFKHFIGVDNQHHLNAGMHDESAADFVAEADALEMPDSTVDFVFASHVLEHMADMGKALAEWGRVLKTGGYLVLYVPSANLYPKVGEPGANPDHKHDIYPGDIVQLLDGTPYRFRQLEAEERSNWNEYSLFEVYEKIELEQGDEGKEPDSMTILMAEKPAKTACVCRFGGFGDMLQTAVVLPRLKEQGFHVTVMTTPQGQNVIRENPYVDEWFILDTDQVPNDELVNFWFVQERERFDRFINLSESIEGHLLALPGRANHAWPLEVRKKRLNVNYHEFTCELAGVRFEPCTLFHATREEVTAARELCPSSEFSVVWVLSGSSLHKFYPHMDMVIARMLTEIPAVRIYLVGDHACKLLEQGWQEEPRVVCLSGEMGIRATLALAAEADLVIGAETGVLNGVGFSELVSKIVFLSHSSANNLTKHWHKVQALSAEFVSCHPCHQLHYDNTFCPQDAETGAARCALNIYPEEVWIAVEKVYRSWERRH
jgi:ADP-heptose:LPS heptosyltransferase